MNASDDNVTVSWNAAAQWCVISVLFIAVSALIVTGIVRSPAKRLARIENQLSEWDAIGAIGVSHRTPTDLSATSEHVSDANSAQPPTGLDNVEDRITKLEMRLTEESVRIDFLEKLRSDAVPSLMSHLADLNIQLKALQSTSGPQPANLDATNRAYSFSRTDQGLVFPVVLDNVVPYIDGHKVELLIGNPYAMTFHGVVLNVLHGPRAPVMPDGNNEESKEDKLTRMDEFLKALNARTAAMKHKTVDLTETLQPGNWNRVVITLAPSKPEQVASLQVHVNVSQLSLSNTGSH